jgi:cell division protein FtsW
MAKKLAFDKALFAAVLLLVGLGLVMVYSASAAVAQDSDARVNPFLAKQAAAILLGLILMGMVMHLDYRRLCHWAVIYGGLFLVAALLVAALHAPKLNETHRWIFVGGVSIQPSELAKLALVPFLAFQLERKAGRVDQPELLVPALGVTGLLAILILQAPHLSAAVLLAATGVLILFLAGLSWKYIAGGALLLLPPAVYFAIGASYRRERLLSFLDPERDPLGAGFQALQSLIAVGSGGVLGVGLGNSAQKLHFLPYPHTDYIYSIVGEELGMAGALTVLALFLLLAWRGARAGQRAPDLFGRYLAWGFTGLLLLQALLHCSVALALLPPTGIPMPFMTYGGSAMVTSLVAAGLILNVSQHAA